MINETQAVALLAMTIQEDVKHQDYVRTLAVRKWAKQILTGKDQDELITQFKQRESDEAKKQRVALYSALTPLAAGKIVSTYRKVRRTDGIQKEVNPGEGEKADRFMKALQSFYGRKPLDQWLFDSKETWTFYDPNTFLGIEFKVVDKDPTTGSIKEIQTYPVEFACHEAINWQYFNGNLQWFLAQRMRPSKEGDNQLSDYYFYAPGFTIHYHELDPDAPVEIEGYEKITIEREAGNAFIALGKVHQTEIEDIPIHPVGEYPDPMTEGRTFITPLHFAEDIFTKLIRDTSYQDLNKTLHTFLQKYVYAPDCDYEHPELGRCEAGYIDGDFERPCQACKGTGLKFHTTEQDVVLIQLPDEGESIVPLSNLVHYVDLPQWFPEFLKEEIEKYIRWVEWSVFNTHDQEIQTVAPKTATEIRVDYDAKYDTLAPYASSYSDLFMFSVSIAAQYEEIELQVNKHSFPASFGMETVHELVALHSSMEGVSGEIRDGVELRIAGKVNRNDPKAVKRIKAWWDVEPMRGKTPEEKMIVITGRERTDPLRFLWENFERIKAEIEHETEGKFCMMKFDKRMEMIDDKVAAMIAELPEEQPQPGPQPLPIGE